MAHSVDALLEQVEVAMAGLNYELATRFADRALEQQADHPAALEMRALIAQQTGDFERAEALLRRSIEVEPNQGARRYMYLGQMLTGEEAANALGKGIELLAAEAQTLAQQGEQYHDEVAQLHSDIAAGFCSLAEVYLTDLCDVEDAQETCLTLMGKALEYDPHNPQTLQTLASIHMSMAQPDEARRHLEQSLALWLKPSKDAGESAAAAADEDEDNEGEEMGDAEMAVAEDEDALPPYEFRINAVKLLLELAEVDTALRVIDQLLIEDDEIMQVWYLQGWALHMAEDEECVESLLKARELYHKNECDRPEVLEHIEELLQEHGASSRAPAAAAKKA